MIRLELMKAWFDHVHDRRSQIANTLAAPWFGREAEVWCGRASSNIICQVMVEGSTYFLRCNHESERTAADYMAEMAFVEYLADRNVSVARPVRSRHDAIVESMETELGLFHAVVVEEAAGEERDLDQLTSTDYGTWGATMAELHAAAAGHERGGRPDWRKHLRFAQET
ncbi:MAG TPA: hypothetical protein VFB34_13110, partial [Chloroflexota bacterium]|nr:hypothetical protein [Chloroflexota bacterium]